MGGDWRWEEIIGGSSTLSVSTCIYITQFIGNYCECILTPCFSTLRIQFKVTLTMWKCIAGYAPDYLQDLFHLLSTISDRRQTRSSVASRFLLEVPRARTVTMQKWAFAYAGPTLWNNMLEAIRSSALLASPNAIKKHLKTLLFSQFCFPCYYMLC